MGETIETGAKQLIVSKDIQDQSILGTDIAPQTITGGLDGQIALQTIIAANIVANTITSNEIMVGSILAGSIAANSIDASLVSALNMIGKYVNFDTGIIGGWTLAPGGLVGPSGSSISSGQTAFNTGIGFWIGNDSGVSKLSVGDSSGSGLAWNGSSLSITGIINALSGTIGGWTLSSNSLVGQIGAIISSGQTDFSVGTGFWLGNVGGVPKFSVGSASGNKMEWDGTNLRITGAFTPTTVFNTFTYTSANLPVPPTIVGFNVPSANE